MTKQSRRLARRKPRITDLARREEIPEAVMAAKKRKPKPRSGRSLTSAERLARGQAKLQVHLPVELLWDVDTLAERVGSSRTAIVQAALEEHLSRVVR